MLAIRDEGVRHPAKGNEDKDLCQTEKDAGNMTTGNNAFPQSCFSSPLLQNQFTNKQTETAEKVNTRYFPCPQKLYISKKCGA